MNIRYQIGTVNCSIVVSVIFVIKKEITKVVYQLYHVKQKKKIIEEDFYKINYIRNKNSILDLSGSGMLT